MKTIIALGFAVGVCWMLSGFFPWLHSTAFNLNTFSVEWALVLFAGLALISLKAVHSGRGR